MVKVWGTFLTTSSYLEGVLTLNYSLVQTNSKYNLIVFYTQSLLDSDPWTIEELQKRNIQVKFIDELKISEEITLAEKRFSLNFSKLNAFKLIEFERIGILDADMLIRANIDELLEMPLSKDSIAATHACVCNPKKKINYPIDWSPGNCAYNMQSFEDAQRTGYECNFGIGMLNGGLIIFEPSLNIHKRFVDALVMNGDIPLLFAEQELISNLLKGMWKPLPYIYNGLKTLRHCHVNIWKDENVKIVHYILDKPWEMKTQKNDESDDEYSVVNSWWREMNERRLNDEKRKMQIISKLILEIILITENSRVEQEDIKNSSFDFRFRVKVRLECEFYGFKLENKNI